MKKILFTALVALSMAASAEMKIATVNMMELVGFHPRHEGDRKLLKGKEADYQKKLDELRESIDGIEKEFRDAQQEAQNPMLTDKAKKETMAKLEEIQKKGLAAQAEYRKSAQDFQMDLQKLEGDLMRAVTGDIREKLEEFAKEGGYDIILDASTTPFAKKELDVTDKVLAAFGVDGAKARAAAKKAEEKAVEGAEKK